MQRSIAELWPSANGRSGTQNRTDEADRSESEGGGSPTRRKLLRALGSVGAAALAGCSALDETPPGPHFRIGTLQPPVTLDPIVAKFVGSAQAIERIFDGLYAYGEGTGIVPKIAAGEPQVSDGGRTIVVGIDERARFQNDRAVTAEDVAYSFEAPVEEGTAGEWLASAIESIETPDDRTVRFEFADPYPAVEHVLTRPIVPRDVRETDPEGFAKAPVGAGPFEVRTFSEEKKTQLVRWEDYWDEPTPALASLTMTYVESPITQMTSLRTNRNDAIEPVSPRVATDVPDVTNASVERRRGYTTFYLGFNLNQGPTTDPRVREAIDYCVDLDEAVEQFVAPIGRRQYSPLPRQVVREWDMPVEEWSEIPHDTNPERARRLFREADEASGQLTVLTSKDPKHKEIGEALAGGLRDAGKGALVVSKPWTSYLEKHVTGAESDYSVFVGEIAATPDPDTALYPAFHENMAGETNGTFYREDAVMERLTAARETRDRERRRELYEEATTRLLEDRVCLPICSFENSFAVAPDVENFRVHPISQVNPRVADGSDVVTIDT